MSDQTKELENVLKEYLEDCEKIIETAKVLQQQALSCFRERFTSDLVIIEIPPTLDYKIKGKLCVAVKSVYEVGEIKYDIVACREKISEEEIPEIVKRHIENVFKHECLALINYIVEHFSEKHKKLTEILIKPKELKIPPIAYSTPKEKKETT